MHRISSCQNIMRGTTPLEEHGYRISYEFVNTILNTKPRAFKNHHVMPQTRPTLSLNHDKVASANHISKDSKWKETGQGISSSCPFSVLDCIAKL
jgi:hypothetical protein